MGGIAGTTVPLTKSKHCWGCALCIAHDANRALAKSSCSISEHFSISRSRSATCTELIIVVVIILAAACEEHDQCQSETSNQSDDPAEYAVVTGLRKRGAFRNQIFNRHCLVVSRDGDRTNNRTKQVGQSAQIGDPLIEDDLARLRVGHGHMPTLEGAVVLRLLRDALDELRAQLLAVDHISMTAVYLAQIVITMINVDREGVDLPHCIEREAAFRHYVVLTEPVLDLVVLARLSAPTNQRVVGALVTLTGARHIHTVVKLGGQAVRDGNRIDLAQRAAVDVVNEGRICVLLEDRDVTCTVVTAFVRIDNDLFIIVAQEAQDVGHAVAIGHRTEQTRVLVLIVEFPTYEVVTSFCGCNGVQTLGRVDRRRTSLDMLTSYCADAVEHAVNRTTNGVQVFDIELDLFPHRIERDAHLLNVRIDPVGHLKVLGCVGDGTTSAIGLGVPAHELITMRCGEFLVDRLEVEACLIPQSTLLVFSRHILTPFRHVVQDVRILLFHIVHVVDDLELIVLVPDRVERKDAARFQEIICVVIIAINCLQQLVERGGELQLKTRAIGLGVPSLIGIEHPTSALRIRRARTIRHVSQAHTLDLTDDAVVAVVLIELNTEVVDQVEEDLDHVVTRIGGDHDTALAIIDVTITIQLAHMSCLEGCDLVERHGVGGALNSAIGLSTQRVNVAALEVFDHHIHVLCPLSRDQNRSHRHDEGIASQVGGHCVARNRINVGDGPASELVTVALCARDGDGLLSSALIRTSLAHPIPGVRCIRKILVVGDVERKHIVEEDKLRGAISHNDLDQFRIRVRRIEYIACERAFRFDREAIGISLVARSLNIDSAARGHTCEGALKGVEASRGLQVELDHIGGLGYIEPCVVGLRSPAVGAITDEVIAIHCITINLDRMVSIFVPTHELITSVGGCGSAIDVHCRCVACIDVHGELIQAAVGVIATICIIEVDLEACEIPNRGEGNRISRHRERTINSVRDAILIGVLPTSQRVTGTLNIATGKQGHDLVGARLRVNHIIFGGQTSLTRFAHVGPVGCRRIVAIDLVGKSLLNSLPDGGEGDVALHREVHLSCSAQTRGVITSCRCGISDPVEIATILPGPTNELVAIGSRCVLRAISAANDQRKRLHVNAQADVGATALKRGEAGAAMVIRTRTRIVGHIEGLSPDRGEYGVRIDNNAVRIGGVLGLAIGRIKVTPASECPTGILGEFDQAIVTRAARLGHLLAVLNIERKRCRSLDRNRTVRIGTSHELNFVQCALPYAGDAHSTIRYGEGCAICNTRTGDEIRISRGNGPAEVPTAYIRHIGKDQRGAVLMIRVCARDAR